MSFSFLDNGIVLNRRKITFILRVLITLLYDCINVKKQLDRNLRSMYQYLINHKLCLTHTLYIALL